MNDTQTDVAGLVRRLDISLGSMTRRQAILAMYTRLTTKAGTTLERAAYLVLKQLTLDGPMRITDLAAHHGVEPSTMTRHTQGLEAAGLITRQSDPDDRRVSLVKATASGSRVVGRVEKERARILEAVISGWEPDDGERFVYLMEQFVTDLASELDRA